MKSKYGVGKVKTKSWTRPFLSAAAGELFLCREEPTVHLTPI